MNADAIIDLLPRVIAQTGRPGTPLAGLVAAMEELHAPDEALLGGVDLLFDPRRAAERFVAFLARWVHFDVLIDTSRPGQRIGRAGAVVADLGAVRELVAGAAELAAWRGTQRGLLRFLRVATGVDGFAVSEDVRDADGMLRPFHLRLTVPAAAADRLDLVHKVMRMGKPAHVTYETVVGG